MGMPRGRALLNHCEPRLTAGGSAAHTVTMAVDGSELRSVSVFSHLNSEKTALYRAILRDFMGAKATFALHLRPADVRAALEKRRVWPGRCRRAGCRSGSTLRMGKHGGAPRHRGCCHGRGVLSAPLSLPAFSRRRGRRAGPGGFLRRLQQPGNCKPPRWPTFASIFSNCDAPDHADARTRPSPIAFCISLTARFEQLTARAQTFLRSLQRTIDLHGITSSLPLIQAGADRLPRAVHRGTRDRHARNRRDPAARSKIAASTVCSKPPPSATRSMSSTTRSAARDCRMPERLWHARWTGLRGWFIGQPPRHRRPTSFAAAPAPQFPPCWARSPGSMTAESPAATGWPIFKPSPAGLPKPLRTPTRTDFGAPHSGSPHPTSSRGRGNPG